MPCSSTIVDTPLSVIPEGDIVLETQLRIQSITSQYETLLKNHDTFQEKLRKEIKDRELDKEKNFKASSLKINLPKF